MEDGILKVLLWVQTMMVPILENLLSSCICLYSIPHYFLEVCGLYIGREKEGKAPTLVLKIPTKDQYSIHGFQTY